MRTKVVFLPTIEIKDCNVMIDGKIFFDQPLKKMVQQLMKTFEKFQLIKVIITQLFPYLIIPISKKHYKMIAIDRFK